MDKNMMMIGLTGLDFSTFGDILKTSAISAGVAGLMYPLSEVTYKLSDNFVKNTIPAKYRKPLPNGYKPSVVKLDSGRSYTPISKDAEKDTEWRKHVNNMDALTGEALKGYTRSLDPKFTSDAYQYLISRGVNPAPGKGDSDYYLQSLKGVKLDFDDSDSSKKLLRDLAIAAGLGSAGYLALKEPKEGDKVSVNLLKSLAPGALAAAGYLGYNTIKKLKSDDSSCEDFDNPYDDMVENKLRNRSESIKFMQDLKGQDILPNYKVSKIKRFFDDREARKSDKIAKILTSSTGSRASEFSMMFKGLGLPIDFSFMDEYDTHSYLDKDKVIEITPEFLGQYKAYLNMQGDKTSDNMYTKYQGI